MRAGEDTVVNNRLYLGGRRTYFCADAAFNHASPSTCRDQLLRHHYQRGRALGRIICGQRSAVSGFRATVGLPVRRLRTISAAARAMDDEMYTRYRDVRGLVVAGALAASFGTWRELLSRHSPAPVAVKARARRDPAAPILALGGRPGPATVGILGAGDAAQASQRLSTFTRYAEHVCAVRPALAPIVTSAAVTAEEIGTYTIDLPRSTVDAYLAAARGVGASLLLQIQPGRASLAVVVERWKQLLVEPDVGIFFDVRPEYAFAAQVCELDHAIARVRRVGGDDTPILVRGVPRDNVWRDRRR